MTLVQGAIEQLRGVGVIGAMRIKNEQDWIQKSIESQLPICEKVLVFDDNSTDATKEIVRSFGSRTVLIESPFQGLSEGRDKQFALAHLVAIDPEWVLWIDGDEVLEAAAPTILAAELANPEATSYAFRICYFWNTLQQFRVDGCYRGFFRNSLFRMRGQDYSRLTFSTAAGALVTSGGNRPVGLQGPPFFSNVRVKHYGYLTAEQRQRKFEWYNQVDPNNAFEDRYRHIIETPGARHAPGPTEFEQWREAALP